MLLLLLMTMIMAMITLGAEASRFIYGFYGVSKEL